MNTPTDWPTTRRYPRSLQQAWPREHANPIEFHRRPSGWLRGVVLAVAIGLSLTLLIVHALAGG